MSLEKPVRLDKETHKKLLKIASANGQTVGGCASWIIKQYAKEHKK